VKFEICTRVEAFGELNFRAQNIVRRRLRAMRKIHRLCRNGSSVAAAARQVAGEHSTTRGWSHQTLTALYQSFTESKGDWTILIDRSVAGRKWQDIMAAQGLPDAFVDFLAQEWALNQRDKFKAIYTKLLLRLERWQCDGGKANSPFTIPGYDVAPQADAQSATDLPAGWHYSNLLTAAKKRLPKFTRRLVQRGPSAAAQLAPMILSTREGLEVGQYIVLDDSWEDFKVMAFGQTVRLLGFHTLDLFSGKNMMRGYKPALRDENEVMQGLKNREMIFLLTGYLTTIGFRPAGTTFIGEKGTANVPDWILQIFHDFGLPIKMERGPAGGGPGLDSLFTGPGGGNPRWKAPLESWFNLQRNASASLLEFPGQVGSYSSGLPMPEGLPGLERDTKLVLSLARTLPLERATMMRCAMLNFTEAVARLHDLVELINCRTDHALEGWRRCGHVVTEWRAHGSAMWQPMEKLLQFQNGELAAISAVLANDASLKRERNLSPAEVFERGSAGLRKMPTTVAAVMLAQIESDAEPVVKKGLIEVPCREVDPDEPLRFGLVRRDGRGTSEPLKDGEKYLVRVNPVAPQRAWLYNADGSFAGCADNYGRAGREDESALHRQFAAKRQYLAPMIADARRLTGSITRADIERNAGNAIAADLRKPVTETEKETARMVRSEGEQAAQDILAKAESGNLESGNAESAEVFEIPI